MVEETPLSHLGKGKITIAKKQQQQRQNSVPRLLCHALSTIIIILCQSFPLERTQHKLSTY